MTICVCGVKGHSSNTQKKCVKLRKLMNLGLPPKRQKRVRKQTDASNRSVATTNISDPEPAPEQCPQEAHNTQRKAFLRSLISQTPVV